MNELLMQKASIPNEDGRTMLGTSELSTDDSTWEKDLELTYTRVE